MRKRKADPIVTALGCTAALMPDPKYRVCDQDILDRLALLDSIDFADSDGRTYLMYSALYGRTAVARYLLERNARVNAADNNQYTPLHFAAQAGHLETARLLIEAGANVNARDSFGNSPLMRCNNATPLPILELLLENGADPMQKNKYGMATADMFAANEDISALIRKYL